MGERRVFTEAFKEEAVRLARMSGRSVISIAEGLGITVNMLCLRKRESKQGRKLSATLLTESLNHVLVAESRASGEYRACPAVEYPLLKLRRWYERLREYKKAGLVRTGLRRRILREICQIWKGAPFQIYAVPKSGTEVYLTRTFTLPKLVRLKVHDYRKSS